MNNKLNCIALLLESMEQAIKSGDWKVDGACDPDSAIVLAKNILHENGLTQNSIAEFNNLKNKYNELIMSVGNKYHNETRHETALRYIKAAESHDIKEASCEKENSKE